MAGVGRSDRMHPGPSEAGGQRTPFQRDRDRIVHSSALRRLAGVTQVVDPAEGHVFHNRLTHTLKVAQIAKRLAEKLQREQPDEAEALGGIDPEVVEAAALAHDLGHPPFGHIAEKELDELLRAEDVSDGYEGNAQSLRILTKLAIRATSHPGLNLTRATLNAVIKYPWYHGNTGLKKKKWGAYEDSEAVEFKWARALCDDDEWKSAEAEIMDWSDDIAYAIHDLEDFFRAGMVPLDRLATYKRERVDFFVKAFKRWSAEGDSTVNKAVATSARETLDGLLGSLPLGEPYRGTAREKAALRTVTSALIDRYVNAIKLRVPAGGQRERRVDIRDDAKLEIKLLKEITRHFVIRNPALASQQYGKARVVQELFKVYYAAATEKKPKWRDILPARWQEDVADGASVARRVADIISGMADVEALTMHRRLLGVTPGSVGDSVPR